MQHWDRNRQRRNLILSILGLFALIQVFISFTSHSTPGGRDLDRMEITQQFRVDMKELSGFGVNPSTNRIFAVSDRKPKLVSFAYTDGTISDFQIGSFRAPLLSAFPFCGSGSGDFCQAQIKQLASQWEAIQLRSDSHYALLQEHSNSIVVMEDNKVAKVYGFHFDHPHLEVPKSVRRRARQNLAEGMLFLNNGHILVVKEFYPPAVVELGPKGATPVGYHRGLLAQEKDLKTIFRGSGRVELHPLAVWTRGDDPKVKCDFSELTAAPNGELVMLSQSCRQIVNVDQLNPQFSYFNPLSIRKLPKKLKHPEALVVLDEETFMVGTDQKRQGDNVYILKDR